MGDSDGMLWMHLVMQEGIRLELKKHRQMHGPLRGGMYDSFIIHTDVLGL